MSFHVSQFEISRQKAGCQVQAIHHHPAANSGGLNIHVWELYINGICIKCIGKIEMSPSTSNLNCPNGGGKDTANLKTSFLIESV